MKKIIFSGLFMLCCMIVLQSFETLKLGKKDGTEPGYTGSPGDSLKNCTACHGGTAYPVNGWIRSDIPAEGYTPLATYTITATNTEFGATRFGFEVSPQALDGALLGTLLITDTGRTKLVGNDKYITYKAAGVEGQDSLSWTFKWIAPPAGTGEVIFYGAFNSNYEGHKGGDQTFLTTLKVQEKGLTGITETATAFSDLRVFPSPADDLANISFELRSPGHVQADLLDLSGKKLLSILDGQHTGMVNKAFSTASLPDGCYLLHLSVDGKTAVRKMMVQHP